MKKLVERNRYLAFTIAIVIYLLLDLGIKFIFGDNDFALTLRSIVPLGYLFYVIIFRTKFTWLHALILFISITAKLNIFTVITGYVNITVCYITSAVSISDIFLYSLIYAVFTILICWIINIILQLSNPKEK